jgi:glycerol-3-phosphate dehydrogenase
VPAVRGEVRLAVETEMACTLADFMDRRSALLLFSPNFGLEGAAESAAIMGSLLGWDDARRADEIAAYQRLAAEHGVPAE